MTEMEGGKWINLQLDELMSTVHKLLDVLQGREHLSIDETIDLAFQNYQICDALDKALMHIFTCSSMIETQVQVWLEGQDSEKAKEYKERIIEYHKEQQKVEDIVSYYNQLDKEGINE